MNGVVQVAHAVAACSVLPNCKCHDEVVTLEEGVRDVYSLQQYPSW